MENSSRRREIAALFAILSMAAALWTIFMPPSFNARADGSYKRAAEALSLEWDDESAPIGDAVNVLEYERYDYASLLHIGQPSIVYPGAIVRLATQPFGKPFDTRLLAAVYAVIIGVGAYMAVSGAYGRSRTLAILLGAMYILMMTHSTIIGYLNSLYTIGAAIAFSMLYFGCLLHALCSPRGSGSRHVVGVVLSGMLLLQSQFQMLVFAPAVLAGYIAAVLHCRPAGRGWAIHLLISLIAMLIATQSVTAYIDADRDVTTDAAGYLAFFQGILPSSDAPEEDLAEIGLDASYAGDIGRSYYEPAENFVHVPSMNPEISEAVSLKNRMRFALCHPERIFKLIGEKKTSLYDAFNETLVTADGDMRYTRISPYLLIDLLTGEGGYSRRSAYMACAVAVSLLMLLVGRRQSGLRGLSIALALFFGGMLLYLPFSVAIDGAVSISMNKVLFFFFGWFGLFFTVAGGIALGKRVFVWLAEKNAVLAPSEAFPRKNLELGWTERMSVSRSGVIALCALLCVGLSTWLLLSENHIAGINNGDFGRMMEQIDLYWTQDLLDDQAAQLSTRAIETYTYREPFHMERLTPADPTYSLLFPSILVRAWSAVSGALFSTRALAFIMLAMTMLAVLLLLHDLYPLLGKITLPAGICLVLMLFGENYVAWYNSLFGESSISTGLMMTVACAVHLAMMERGSRKCWLWMALLALSVRFLCCAKAQMALALPSGLILIAAFALYHRPKVKKLLVPFVALAVLLCAWTSWDTYNIYRKNAGVSDKQTVWQSVFYGALMISDDPDAAMEELGIDPAMKADIGKHAYYADSEYVYPLLSEAAEEAFYSKVSTSTMVLYYLRHPMDLLKMLNRAAEESRELHTGFMAYSDELYAEHGGLYRFNIWRMIRPVFACGAFWQYVLLYGGVLIFCIRRMCKRAAPGWKRLLPLVFVCVMLIGVLQYPLSVVGNGYADNNKQLYCFMLCHDLMLILGGAAALKAVIRFAKRG